MCNVHAYCFNIIMRNQVEIKTPNWVDIFVSKLLQSAITIIVKITICYEFKTI